MININAGRIIPQAGCLPDPTTAQPGFYCFPAGLETCPYCGRLPAVLHPGRLRLTELTLFRIDKMPGHDKLPVGK